MNRLDKNSAKKKKNEIDEANPINNANENNDYDNSNNNEKGIETENKVLKSLLKKKKVEKFRVSLYLNKNLFEKLITVSGESEESFTNIIEALLEDSLADVKIKPKHVKKYMDDLEKKRNK